jgi:hypothetical protein
MYARPRVIVGRSDIKDDRFKYQAAGNIDMIMLRYQMKAATHRDPTGVPPGWWN